jgi:phosphoribosyl-AMP cyclohydrolase
VATKKDIEENLEFVPKFDENGLIPAIAQDARTGQILMVAYMNRQALAATIESGCATYFSRSRGKLWKKGEESGHLQKVEQIVLKVAVDAGQCHVGYQSCFYRALSKNADNKLEFVAEKVYDPQATPKKPTRSEFKIVCGRPVRPVTAAKAPKSARKSAGKPLLCKFFLFLP